MEGNEKKVDPGSEDDGLREVKQILIFKLIYSGEKTIIASVQHKYELFCIVS